MSLNSKYCCLPRPLSPFLIFIEHASAPLHLEGPVNHNCVTETSDPLPSAGDQARNNEDAGCKHG